MAPDYIAATLTPDDIGCINKLTAPRLYRAKTEIIYHGQTPEVAFLLLEGTILLTNQKKEVKRSLYPGQLIGINELLNNERFKWNAVIEACSTVLILDRSTIKELSQNQDCRSVLSKILSAEVATNP